ncbi:MAG: tetratricopeptide (TPR) repeat protein [Candidatus Azotimanducaceae bacterium]|jgi:tetratricopeptide (TPR) repeat protein
MDSSSGNHRRLSFERGKIRTSDASARPPSRTKRIAPTQSFAPPPSPLRETSYFSETKRRRPTFKVFLAAFCGVILLVLLGGTHNAVALGTALLLPGLALLIKPPTTGLGKLGDLGAAGLLLCFLLAFLPQFYWSTPEWRLDAAESLGVDLPSVLSMQPWISFEAWLMAVAGFAWFYAAIQWPVNFSGRRWLFFFLSILLAAIAGTVIWGNLIGMRYPGAEDATASSFFSNRNQTANFLALGGVATFAYAMEGLRSRRVMAMVGVPASILCLVGLVLSASMVGLLLYFVGVGLWFVCSLRAGSLPRLFKIGFPIVIIAFSAVVFSNEKLVQRIVGFVSSDSGPSQVSRIPIYSDTTAMVLDAPLSGFGLGSFSAVFPQYREASATFQSVVHPESDLFWLASEGGLLAVCFFALFLFGYALRCRGFDQGVNASYRVLALVAVLVFLLHTLVDVPGHRPGAVYFAILFAALSLPSRERPKLLLPSIFWRFAGGLLTVFGLVWLAAGVFNLPWHSSVRLKQHQDAIRSHISVGDFTQAKEVADDWLALRPLDWQAYFQRAQLTLSDSGNQADAAADFTRARFVEPILGIVSYEEGKIWLPYDPARAVSAWRQTLLREMESKDGVYQKMLQLARKHPEVQEGMARLSEVDPYYRVYFLCFLQGDELMGEIRRELSKDPSLSRFSVEQRTAIVRAWLKSGNLDEAEVFLTEYSESLENSWWLFSLLRKGQADFEAALEVLRENVEVPKMPDVRLDEAIITRLTREYVVAPKDIMKGTSLLYIYVQKNEYERALPILDRLLESHKPPLYLYYWRAECLYQVEEYFESWYAFETYLEKLWESLQLTDVRVAAAFDLE